METQLPIGVTSRFNIMWKQAQDERNPAEKAAIEKIALGWLDHQVEMQDPAKKRAYEENCRRALRGLRLAQDLGLIPEDQDEAEES